MLVEAEYINMYKEKYFGLEIQTVSLFLYIGTLGEKAMQTFENTLACLSVAQMGSNHGKNRSRKSRDTLPLIKEGHKVP